MEFFKLIHLHGPFEQIHKTKTNETLLKHLMIK